MARFQILPIELKFFEWFNKSADNVLEASRLFYALLSDYRNVESRVAQLTELEHRGDFIVHEIMDLLSHTFLTPLEGDEIRALTSSLDDVVDHIEAAADALLLYKVEQPIPEAIQLARLLLDMAEQVAIAVPMIADTKRLPEVHKYTVEINRLENEADRVHRLALARLVEERSDWFELFRWKEILEIIEEATDRCEDVADVLGVVIQKNA
jgi:predicted phosphate transport protein (TIGR00153 family)